MRKETFALALPWLGVLSAILTVGWAQKPVASDIIPLTVTFRDYPGSEAVPADAINSDGLGPYREGQGVKAHLRKDNGDLYFSSWLANRDKGQIPRNFFLDFRRPAGEAPCASTATCRRWFETVLYQAHILARVLDVNGELRAGGMLEMAVGERLQTRMKVNFYDPAGSGVLFTIRLDRTGFPRTYNVWTTRLDENSWIVESGAYREDQGQLFSEGFKLTAIDEGNYYLPFQMVLQKN